MLKTIDLFAGAGGLSYGFESTREFLIVAAAENNKNARKTYVENHKGRNDIRLIPDVRDYDFSALASEFDGIDVVIGGPPCQGFSNANRQKNHIISMNNSLVKEYFRAVKEIRPKAFVMENVSMLSSETHRFYDSAKDHDVVTSLGVQMREDELVLADSDYNGYSLVNIIQADAVADYKISDELFQLLNVLYKNRNSEERLSKYIKNKSKLIIDKIASQAEEVKNNLGILNWIVDMINTEQISACFTELGQFIKFQKTFRLKEELDSNDSSIMDNTVIGYCSGYEKQSILGGQVFCISSLLASVIYYACIEVKNSDCAEAIKSITGEYVKEFEDGEPIYFEGSDAKPKPKLTYTLQDPSFDKVFVKVKSWLINLLSGVTEIEIYKVSDVTNRQLRFNRMREYLIDHIGEYVFSRANVSEIIFIQIVELVGRTNKQLFLKNSLKINRMLYYMKIKTKSSRYKMWQQKEYYQLY